MGVIEDKLKLLPVNPGVYVMLNSEGQIIYVGKAKNLKNRVRQYFFNSLKTEKVMAMVSNVADFYYYIVPSEIDALSLENNLIKKYKPRYNILLKDDKTYPYITVNLKEEYPAFKVTRRIKKDGAKYFGPFMGGVNVSGVLDVINLAYKVRPCDKQLSSKKKLKPCLNYHIGKCYSPCSGAISREEYNKQVLSAVDFLNGETAGVEKILKEKMLECAESEQFELAQKYKEGLESLEKIKLKRITSLNKFLDIDVIATSNNGIYSSVSLLVIRKGIMLGGKKFSFENVTYSEQEALSEFITSYYTNGVDLPDEIICSVELPDAEVLENYFKKTYNKSVNILCAKQGIRKQLTDMAKVNADEYLETSVSRITHKNDMTITACNRLKEILSLKNYPKRMECYDISHISGTDKVGSMVVFIDGEKASAEYRRFKIKTVSGSDDFACLQEVLRRRLERLKTDPEKFPKPQLIIIDGGKGQLSSVNEIFDEYNVSDIDLISLAKREEEIFLPKKSTPIVLPHSDYCLKLMQRIRDEAHRFAITYHRELRGKRALSSVLDKVEGIGKVKINALLTEFKDLQGIINASKIDLCKVKGIGEKEAENIINTLTKEGLR